MNTNETSLKPPGYWFGVIEHRLRQKMREAFNDLDLSRGEWRILDTLADGPKSVDEIEAALPPGEWRRRMAGRKFGAPGPGFGAGFGPGFGPWGGRGFGPWAGRGYGPGFGSWSGRGYGPWFADGSAEGPDASAEHHEHASDAEHHEHAEPNGHTEPNGHAEHHEHPGNHEHHGHPGRYGYPGHHGFAGAKGRGERREYRPRSVAEVLVSFTERGWVVLADGTATLTDAGRTAHDAAQSRVTELRASVTEGISDEEYAAMVATLEKMARNVGWTDATEADEAEAESDADAESDAESDADAEDDSGPEA